MNDATETNAEIGQPLKAREHPEAAHPTPRKYVNIAIVLGLITAFEVGVYYIEALRDVLVALLIGCMVLKFVLVARWFMHLRFDSPGYARTFITGIALAATVYVVVLLTLGIV